MSSGWIISINENRLKEVGFAILAKDGNEIYLYNVVDSICYSKTQSLLSGAFPPSEILLPKGSQNTALKKQLEKVYSGSEIVLIDRKYFNESKGERSEEH